MTRPSSGSCTSFSPGCDVKYLAPDAATHRGPLSTRALTVWEQANGTCVLVHPAGLEPACPWATPFEGVVYPGSTTDACSPCLLVKGTDCAGVILACLRGWWSRSLVPVLGTSPLNGQSPHRAMFTYPCSGKTTVGRLVGCM